MGQQGFQDEGDMRTRKVKAKDFVLPDFFMVPHICRLRALDRIMSWGEIAGTPFRSTGDKTIDLWGSRGFLKGDDRLAGPTRAR